MGQQLPLFASTKPSKADELDASIAEMRLAEMNRKRPPFRAKHHRSIVARCPKCGAHVTVRVSA